MNNWEKDLEDWRRLFATKLVTEDMLKQQRDSISRFQSMAKRHSNNFLRDPTPANFEKMQVAATSLLDHSIKYVAMQERFGELKQK